MRKATLLLFLTLSLCFASPSGARSLFVVTLFSPPIAFEENGKVVGIGADVVREGLRRMGIEAHISIMPWKRAVFMTRFGEADAIFYAVRNPEREQWFHYPDESLIVESTIALKRVDGPIEMVPEKHDYSNIRLGIGRGFYYGPRLKGFLDKARFAKVEEAATIDTNFNKLVEGRVDVILADMYLARHFMKKRASRGVVDIVADKEGNPVVFDSVDSYLAFSRETSTTAMANHFSEILREMKADGSYDAILEKYR